MASLWTTQMTVEEREYNFYDMIADDKNIPKHLEGLAAEIDKQLRQLAETTMVKLGDGSEKDVLLASMKSVRRIIIAWNKYPGVNCYLGLAKIDALGYLHTALGAVAPAQNCDLPKEIAKLLGQKVAFAAEATENDVLREVALAACAAHIHWYNLAQDLSNVFTDDQISVESEPQLHTYEMWVSQEGADRVQREQERMAREVAKKKKRAQKMATSSSPKETADPEGDAADADSPTPAQRRSKKRKTTQDTGESDETTQQPAPKKRKADPTLGGSQTDNVDTRSAGKKGEKKRDTELWLRDEEDALFTKVLQDPYRMFDEVYREHNQDMSGTAHSKDDGVQYRTKFVECTMFKGVAANRDADETWRTFEALRNHVSNQGKGDSKFNFLAKAKKDHDNAKAKWMQECKERARRNGTSVKAEMDKGEYRKPRRAWVPKPVNTVDGFPKKDGTPAQRPPQGVWIINLRKKPFTDKSVVDANIGPTIEDPVFEEQVRVLDFNKLAQDPDFKKMVGSVGKCTEMDARMQFEESRDRYKQIAAAGLKELREVVEDQDDDEVDEEEGTDEGDVEEERADEKVADEDDREEEN